MQPVSFCVLCAVRLCIEMTLQASAARCSACALFLAALAAELWMAANDYELMASMFANPKLGGTQRLQLADEDVACFKDAMARPGCLTAAFDYYRRAAVATARPGADKRVQAVHQTWMIHLEPCCLLKQWNHL
jgi:hypothetical protein